jgi:protein-tyrosine-phosphatase
MAAGLMRHLAGDRVEVLSGGSEPGASVNPLAVEVMAERGIDIDSAVPRHWTDEEAHNADVIVTMGCGDACPVYPGRRYLDWELDDPSNRTLDEVRQIRDEIEQRVVDLLAELSTAT